MMRLKIQFLLILVPVSIFLLLLYQHVGEIQPFKVKQILAGIAQLDHLFSKPSIHLVKDKTGRSKNGIVSDKDFTTREPRTYPHNFNTSQDISQGTTGPLLKFAIAEAKAFEEFQEHLKEKVTPEGFIDIAKTGDRTTKPAGVWQLRKEKYGNFKQLEGAINPKKIRGRASNSSSNSILGKFVVEQRRRQKVLQRQCKKSSNMSFRTMGITEDVLLAQLTYPHLIFDRANQLTFCPVYKSASTSWSVILLQLRGLWKSKGKKASLQGLLRQVFPSITAIAGPMLVKNTIKFVIVRHPFERLVSCYRDKFEHATKFYYYSAYGEKMVKLFRKKPDGFTEAEIQQMLKRVTDMLMKQLRYPLPGNAYANPLGPTFHEFVQYITRIDRDDEHWRPVFTHCSPCSLRYDAVLKFENLYEDSLQFIEFLNKTSKISPRWENMSEWGVSSREVACDYFRQLNVSLVTRLMQKYEKDFLMFEYSADEFLKCAKDYVPGDTVPFKRE